MQRELFKGACAPQASFSPGMPRLCISVGSSYFCTCSGSTYIKIGTIQRRLAWPLRKDDTQIREAFQIFRPCPKHPYTFWIQRQRKLVCFGKFSRAVNQNPPIWLVVWFVLENLPELSIKMLQSDWSFGLFWKITQFWSIIRFPYSKLTREDNNSYFLYESVAMKIAVL